MIGIVIVSHSAALAAGLRDVAVQMVRDQVPIAVAGGVGDDQAAIGTDPLRVLQAIQSVYSEEGVVVLMDLGSAILGAETALELLPPEQRDHVHLCEAPLVEGTLAAAICVMAGGSLSQVLAEARAALHAKTAQLRSNATIADGQSAIRGAEEAPQSPIGAETRMIIVSNPLGLHLRPAARLVELASCSAVEITLTKGKQTVNANSINAIAMLGVRQGDRLLVCAAGANATDLLDAVEAILTINDGSKPSELTTAVTSAIAGRPPSLHGIPASTGVAVGPVLLFQAQMMPVQSYEVADTETEWARLQGAIAAAIEQLTELYTITARLGDAEAAIFSAHRLILCDPELQAAAHNYIQTQRLNAEAAWQRVVDAWADRYQLAPHFELRQRAIDLSEVGQRVQRHLAGLPTITLTVEQPAILVASRLAPSDTALLDPASILGIVTEEGGPTDHSSILARALGIPAVIGVPAITAHVSTGVLLALDGASGQVWLTPDEELVAQLRRQQTEQLHQRASSRRLSSSPFWMSASRQPGELRTEIVANIDSPQEAALALAYGAAGVGLFRTEFLFLGRSHPPSEEEQFNAYVATAMTLGNRTLVIRTLDAGGDKPLPYLQAQTEPNPFLGLRGIRFWLEHSEIARVQLRALLRTAALHSLRLMLPMVSTIDEVRQARALMQEVHSQLQREGVTFPSPPPLGIMIETPAAVLLAAQLAQEVDFFSIGTNDLAQYLMAADRSNLRVTGLANSLQPGVITAIQQVVQVARAAGIGVGVCGEMAGDPLATELLVGLGVDNLSMHPAAIPVVRKRLMELDWQGAATFAASVLALNSVSEVEQLLRERMIS